LCLHHFLKDNTKSYYNWCRLLLLGSVFISGLCVM
jgi:hypothetical protein